MTIADFGCVRQADVSFASKRKQLPFPGNSAGVPAAHLLSARFLSGGYMEPLQWSEHHRDLQGTRAQRHGLTEQQISDCHHCAGKKLQLFPLSAPSSAHPLPPTCALVESGHPLGTPTAAKCPHQGCCVLHSDARNSPRPRLSCDNRVSFPLLSTSLISQL